MGQNIRRPNVSEIEKMNYFSFISAGLYTDCLAQYPGPQRMVWLKLAHEFVSVAQQKIFIVVPGYKQSRHVNTEHLEQLHVVSQKGQALHQHDTNAPGRQDKAAHSGLVSQHGTAPCHTIPLWEETRAAGALGAQWLHGRHWCNCPAEAKCCCLHSCARGLDWYLCWRMPSAVPQHSFSRVHYDLPNGNKKAGFYSDFSLYFKCCDTMFSQQQGMQCAIRMNRAAPRMGLVPKLHYKCLYIIFLSERLLWQTVTLWMCLAHVPSANTAHSPIKPMLKQHGISNSNESKLDGSTVNSFLYTNWFFKEQNLVPENLSPSLTKL